MITYETTLPIARSAEHTFDVVGTHNPENHPKWEREVLEVRRLSAGPVAVGFQGVMVRKEFGRRSEVPYECTEFEPGRRVVFVQAVAAMDFSIAFTVTPTGPERCDLQIAVQLQPKGPLRLLGPVFRLKMSLTGKRLSGQMKKVIESQSSPAHSPT